jgi:hypothetical protein
MAFACGAGASAQTLQVTITAPAAVGAFLEVAAQADEGLSATAQASSGGVQVAHATGSFRL